ncbi:hypothetical protein [Amycolatopsis sp. cmx-4-54]|uniref:hypothetical protein n=1 Tax=Amycolatopsis sp. cmx-4-54 TaxID=2790936 RepID=UPI00397979C7
MNATALSGIRTLLGSVLSALTVGGGLYYTGRKFFLDRDKQFTDRFNSAIDHLGSPEATVRAGGVRTLDRIQHYSPTDRNRVLESINGFLRHQTSRPVQRSRTRRRGTGPPAQPRDREKRAVADNPLDLRKIRVGEADLRGLVSTEADLSGAELTGAHFADASFDPH